ncbi:hypothetical protein IU414_06475 [Nocardia farcinica]|uniref:hypothetical protein n=1 Tax=Nocardia farcinica TaxID=37329 RepID=UPI0018959BE4|nr:hypothetical protein [Nocardia farcinica]MBF6254427.1 hypothetical protein [Nocardia farcinica]MBF6584404.1 hypothetical protein [Nocardia farcinica]
MDFPNQVCIDCPACGGHSVVDEGEQWCMNCRWELGQVERHVGPPVETGFRVGDVVLTEMLTMGRVNYIDPSGFVDMLSSGWTMRYEPEELRKVKPRTSYAGDIALGLDPLEPGQYPPVRMLWELSEEGAA